MEQQVTVDNTCVQHELHEGRVAVIICDIVVAAFVIYIEPKHNCLWYQIIVFIQHIPCYLHWY